MEPRPLPHGGAEAVVGGGEPVASADQVGPAASCRGPIVGTSGHLGENDRRELGDIARTDRQDQVA